MTFAATVAASSQAKGVTTSATMYTAGAEVYALFTAAFTGAGSGTSYQRIGLYDTNNGFFVGFEGGRRRLFLDNSCSNTIICTGAGAFFRTIIAQTLEIKLVS